MAGPWKVWKSKSSFSTLSTVPWKSRKDREISTFPQPRGDGLRFNLRTEEKKMTQTATMHKC